MQSVIFLFPVYFLFPIARRTVQAAKFEQENDAFHSPVPIKPGT